MKSSLEMRREMERDTDLMERQRGNWMKLLGEKETVTVREKSCQERWEAIELTQV